MSDQKRGFKTPFDHSTRFAQKRLHLGVCGSVACYRAADLLRAWRGMGMHCLLYTSFHSAGGFAHAHGLPFCTLIRQGYDVRQFVGCCGQLRAHFFHLAGHLHHLSLGLQHLGLVCHERQHGVGTVGQGRIEHVDGRPVGRM